LTANDAFAVPEIFQGIKFIDSHQHFWQLSRFPYRWLAPSAAPARFGDKASIRRDFMPADYLHDMSGIPLAASVHVQANCGAADPVKKRGGCRACQINPACQQQPSPRSIFWIPPRPS